MSTMLLKLLLISVLIKSSIQLCMICPTQLETRWWPFVNCECSPNSIGVFYDIETKKCVDIDQCPGKIADSWSKSINDITVLAPPFFESLGNSIEHTKLSTLPWPKDFKLIYQTIEKRKSAIRKQWPQWIAPVVASIVSKNKDILGDCKGQYACVFMEIIRSKDYNKEMLRHLRHLLEKFGEEVVKGLEELIVLGKDCNYGNCPIVKAVIDMKHGFRNLLGEAI